MFTPGLNESYGRNISNERRGMSSDTYHAGPSRPFAKEAVENEVVGFNRRRKTEAANPVLDGGHTYRHSASSTEDHWITEVVTNRAPLHIIIVRTRPAGKGKSTSQVNTRLD